jgi:uncharacterized protein YjiS (DUF1127 family)
MLRISKSTSGTIGNFGGSAKSRRLLLKLCTETWRVIDGWTERSRQRQALAQLDDRGLADLGLTRSQVTDEIEKPFWR